MKRKRELGWFQQGLLRALDNQRLYYLAALYDGAANPALVVKNATFTKKQDKL